MAHDQRARWYDAEPAHIRHAVETLEEHFGQPVLPLRRVCDTITTWMDHVRTLNQGENQSGYGSTYHGFLNRVRIDISKSNLLWRLLYLDEPIRTSACLSCHGHWGHLACRQCRGVGWLPEGEARSGGLGGGVFFAHVNATGTVTEIHDHVPPREETDD